MTKRFRRISPVRCSRGDAERIVCMSSTHIAMLDAIGETGRVVGVSGIDYISNPDIQARRDSVGDVGYEGNINYELLLSLDPRPRVALRRERGKLDGG